ncbi:MAG: hypothetical protein HPY61_00540 [Methanotrichaceae archaeon]|nr:hypothetical protein [Methanotrichaceae archaeon]
MKAKEIVVLGGYGGAGSCISRLLLEETGASIVIAGRRTEMAEELARILNSKYPGRTTSAFADASDPESLAAVFENADLVVVASTTADHVQTVAQAAIDTGIDYLDIHYPQQVVTALNPLASQIELAGLRFITQAGFCPGLPSTLVRLAALHLEDIRRAIVGVAMNTRFEKGGALYELLDSFADFRGEVFEGRWRPAGLRDTATIDFGHLFGRKQCYLMNLAEMRPLPKALQLKELGVYAAGINWFVDYLVIPWAYVLGRIRKSLGREALASMMVWGTKLFSPPEEEVVLVVEAEGNYEERDAEIRIVLEHEDAYYITAAPVVACIRQLLDGRIKPGLQMMGLAIDPELLIKDIRRMGINVEYKISGNGQVVRNGER